MPRRLPRENIRDWENHQRNFGKTRETKTYSRRDNFPVIEDASSGVNECNAPDAKCSTLPDHCFNDIGTKGCVIYKSLRNCTYGEMTWVVCAASKTSGTKCLPDRNINRAANPRIDDAQPAKNISFECAMCYLTPNADLIFDDHGGELSPWGYNIGKWPRCRTMSNDDPLFKVPHIEVVAQVTANHFCIGQRFFRKKVRCNSSSGKKWSKACILSILAGGFGGDRFYLNYWRSAIGKLLTFGGLG